jgi:hypothetical protein
LLSLAASAPTWGPPAGCETLRCQEAAFATCEPCMHRVCQICSMRALASVDLRCACCSSKLVSDFVEIHRGTSSVEAQSSGW